MRPGVDEPVIREAPKNIALEQQLLGALLLKNEVYHRFAPRLQAAHFFDSLHGDIFEAIERLISAGKVANAFTLQGYFANAEPIDAKTTVRQYLGTLMAHVTSTTNVAGYAEILIALAVRRTVIVAAEELAAEAYDTSIERSPNEMIEAAEARLYAAAPREANEKRETSLSEALNEAITRASAAHERGDGLSGVSTGITALDEKTGGLSPGNLIVIAGRPGMGKTALAINIADNLAIAGVPVGFFSLEMSREELAARILARHSTVALHKITRGTFREADMAAMLQAKQRLDRLPLTINETGGLTVAQLRASTRRLHRKGLLEVLIVDYLQLMQATPRGGGGNRTSDVTEITNGLKAIAKELHIPIIALSQLSRAVEVRDNKRPQLSDLRESGSIEQDADVVLMCYREAYYVERDKPEPTNRAAYSDWLAKLDLIRGQAEVIVAKARQGTLGTAELSFDGSTTTFFDPPEPRP